MAKGKEIKVDDNFSIQWDSNCFNLIEYYKGKTRDGEDEIKTKITYHNTIKSIARTILKKKTANCETLKDILELYERSNGLIEGIYGTIWEKVKDDEGIRHIVTKALENNSDLIYKIVEKGISTKKINIKV